MLRKSLMFVALLALFGTAAWAKPPITFSFASDDYHEGPTFSGSDWTVTAKARVDLMTDQQGDFEGGVFVFPSWLELQGNLHEYQVVPIANGNFLHIWHVEGFFEFVHYDAVFGFPHLLRTPFKYAVLTSQSPFPNQAGETMTLQGSFIADNNVVLDDGFGLEAALNLWYPDDYVGSFSDFAFTLTNVRTGGIVGPPPTLLDDGSFRERWQSEGSFSASGGNG